MDPEIKYLLEQDQKATAELRAKVEQLEKRPDGVTAEEVKRLQAELAQTMSIMDARIADVEARRELKKSAPSADELEVKSFLQFMRRGDETEVKAMVSNSNADGGYLAPTTMAAGVMARMRRSSPMRAVASVVQASTYETLVERGEAGFEWAGETQTRSETASPTINKIMIPTHDLSAMPKISQRMLDEAIFDVGGWLEQRVADRFARGEATAFISGSGVDRPKGILTYATSTAADESRADQTLQIIKTTAAGAFATTGPADVFTKAFYQLQDRYANAARWMMKNTTAAVVATLKNGDGTYLLGTMMNADGTLLRTIHGRPVVIADDMPVIENNALAIAVGDFSKYVIVDNGQFRVLRDPYSAKPFVQFYCTKRVGGGVTDFDAIKFIQMAA
jgi:HK97 family phage major capsid protein